jgi:hypothetical protein
MKRNTGKRSRRKNRSRAVRRELKPLRKNHDAAVVSRKIKSRGTKRNRALGRKIKSPGEKIPTTARQYFSRSKRFQETWDAVAHVISKMRSDGVLLSKASKEFGIDPNVVLKFGRAALRKQKNGRYIARKTDRLLRILAMITPEARRDIAVRDSRQASIIGSYWTAVHFYLQTGDDSALRSFTGKKVTDASGKRLLLLTDTRDLDRLGSAGVLSFESLYAGGN